MSIFAGPGATIEASLPFSTGVLGTLRIRIVDTPAGATFLAASTTGVTEVPAGGGVYFWTGTGPTTAGTYTVYWDLGSDATIVGVEDLVVSYSSAVTSSPSGSDLCTVADVKQAMESVTTLPASIDTMIQTLITAASVMIPNRYQRDFAPVTAATYTFKVIGFMVDLAPHDLRSATTVTLDPNGTPIVLAATQYRLAPSGAESNLGTYTAVELSRVQNLWSTSVTNFGYAELGILGNWGPAAVTSDVARACALTVASWMSARIAASSSDFLGDLAHQSREVRPDRFGGFAIPFDAHMILSQYDRPAASFA